MATLRAQSILSANQERWKRFSPSGSQMEFIHEGNSVDARSVMQSESLRLFEVDEYLEERQNVMEPPSPIATDALRGRHDRLSHDYTRKLATEVGDLLNSNLIRVVAMTNNSESSSLSLENLSDVYLNSSGAAAGNQTEVHDYFYRHSPVLTVVYCVAYFLVFIIGLVGNCLVVAVVFRAPRMRTVTNLFIVNLAIADILVVVLCIPATLLGNIFVPWVLGWWMCKTVPYVQGVSVAASVYSLIAVSLDRFLAIWWPLKCQITKRRARVIIVVIWVVACTTTIPWALYFDLVIFSEAPDVLLCLEVWPESLSGSLYFLVVNLVFCYILPLILISLCYILIWIKVWRRTIPTDTKDLQMEKMQQKSKVKVVKMLVVVVIIFVVSWMPLYIIFARIKLGGDFNHWEENLLAYITPVAQWMGSSNSCINPILYAFFNKKYRRGFVAILKSKKCCGRLRYYETVAMMGSSSSMRNKSSFYINYNNNNNSSTRKPPPQDTSVSYIFNNFGV